MTREEIISMAREVSDPDKVDPVCSQEDFITLTPDELERFASMVAAYEREECAKLCDRHAADFSVFDRQPYESMEAGAAGCAAAIRARSEK